MIYSYYIFICSLSVVVVFFFKSKESAEMNYSVDVPAMPKAHFLPHTLFMSSSFVTVVVLRMLFQCSLCFLGGPLLKILRAGSLHFPRRLFLFNPLRYYTSVFNSGTELMFKGPAMADTILPETMQIRKFNPIPTVITKYETQ